MKFALDTKRRIDENGFLHVGLSNISKECVSPYYGYEIPNYKEHKIIPDKVYYAYRSAYELNLAVDTFNGLPLLRGHYIEHAENPQKEHRVGSLGTECCFSEPYLQNTIVVTDAEAIRKIENGERVELSAAYAYNPIFDSGTYKGQKYDFIMTNIRGNHVALVEEGRVGSDVVVADSNSINKNEKKVSKINDELIQKDKEEQGFRNDENKSLEELFFEFEELVNDFKRIVEKYRTHEEYNEDSINLELSECSLENNNQGVAVDKISVGMSIKNAENIEEKIRSEVRAQYQEMQKAVTRCVPFTGEMDIFAFDSAQDIYLHTCNILNVYATKESAKDVVSALIKNDNIQNVNTNKRVFRSRFD